MKEYCENERCENPGYKEVAVSVKKPGDEKRTLCASCEEAYSIGVQHGTITAHQEIAVRHVEKFLVKGGFVILGLNRLDPSRQGAHEAWAYQGPLDFNATPVVFGVGQRVRDALIALDMYLADPKLQRRRAGRDKSARTVTVEMDNRELATVLAALRFHQDENLAGGKGIADQAIAEIATDGGRLKPLSAGEIDQLCLRLNCGASSAVKPAVRGLTIDPPGKESGQEQLFRVVYTIDVNASDAHQAAELVHLTMTDPEAGPPVLEIIDHLGTVVTIDLAEQENPDQKGGGS